MRKSTSASKILLFIVMVMALLCITVGAMADECEPGMHKLEEIITVKPTCNSEGRAITKCSVCGYVVANSERTVSKLPHDFVWKTSVPAQCQIKGQEHQVCKVCGAIGDVRDTAALDHDWGAWTVTKAAGCGVEGVETRVCKLNASHVENRPIAALDHDWGAWTVTKAATCEGKGTETRVCKLNSAHTENRAIAPLGHLYGTPVTTPATCVKEGSIKQVCQRDSSHVISTPIPIDPNAHDWGAWSTVKKPDCTNPGLERRVCKLSSTHIQEKEIPYDPNAHVWDKGTVTKKPTLTSEGEKKYVCQINHEHVKLEKLPPQSMTNNTVCAFGPRLRDVNLYPYDTDLWYMFTPFDASKDGVQTYELVASNMYIVGKVTLTIKEGNLRIDYTLNDPQKFKITLEFFTVLNRINDLTQYEPEELLYLRMNKNQDISLADFGEDTSLVLYFCSRCDYSYSAKYLPLDYDSNAHQRLLRSMLELMD